jgi:ABC-type Na+ efflux pump permease subunit
MTWIATGIAVLGAGATVYGKHRKGQAAARQDTAALRAGANEVATAERELSWDEYTTDRNRAFEVAAGQVMQGAAEGSKNMMAIFKEGSAMVEKGGFAGSSQSESAVVEARANVRDEQENIVAGASSDLTFAGKKMNLQQTKNLAAIEERLQSRLDEISTINDSYSEGFWS